MAHESEFVDPAIVRIALSSRNGTPRWIEVKRELNAGEERHVFTDLVKRMDTDPITGKAITQLNPEKVGLTKVLAYLLAWSFVDADGKPVPVSESSLNNLRGATYREIVAAVDQHEDDMEAAQKAAQDQDPTGAIGSSAT